MHKISQKRDSSWSSLNKNSSKSEHNRILGLFIPKTRDCGLSGHTNHRPRQLFLRLSRLLITVMRKPKVTEGILTWVEEYDGATETIKKTWSKTWLFYTNFCEWITKYGIQQIPAIHFINRVKTRPNEFGSMTARKDDSSPIKSTFCHKRP